MQLLAFAKVKLVAVLPEAISLAEILSPSTYTSNTVPAAVGNITAPVSPAVYVNKVLANATSLPVTSYSISRGSRVSDAV